MRLALLGSLSSSGLGDELSLRTAVNRELSCLKNIFNRCIEWKRFEGDNPVKDMKMVKETRGRRRFLDYDEEDQLLARLQSLGALSSLSVHCVPTKRKPAEFQS